MATRPRYFMPDDVLDLPSPDGAIGYELVDGQSVPVMPASLVQGRLIVKVAGRIDAYVAEHGLPGLVLSDSGFVLGLRRDPRRMRGPDVAYVERSRLEGQDPERLIRGVPDLAVEIDLFEG
jgi:Uma2 family endonuclease